MPVGWELGTYQQQTWHRHLTDDLENDFFGEDDDDFIVLAAAASVFARRNLNRILGYFEQTIPA